MLNIHEIIKLISKMEKFIEIHNTGVIIYNYNINFWYNWNGA